MNQMPYMKNGKRDYKRENALYNSRPEQRKARSERTVLRNQIKTLQSQNLSLMPEGLEGAIDHQQMADLIAFLRTSAVGEN